MQPDNGAVQAHPVPMMAYLAAAARSNDCLAPTGVVSHTTLVAPTNNVADLPDEDDDDDGDFNREVVHKVECV